MASIKGFKETFRMIQPLQHTPLGLAKLGLSKCDTKKNEEQLAKTCKNIENPAKKTRKNQKTHKKNIFFHKISPVSQRQSWGPHKAISSALAVIFPLETNGEKSHRHLTNPKAAHGYGSKRPGTQKNLLVKGKIDQNLWLF